MCLPRDDHPPSTLLNSKPQKGYILLVLHIENILEVVSGVLGFVVLWIM